MSFLTASAPRAPGASSSSVPAVASSSAAAVQASAAPAASSTQAAAQSSQAAASSQAPASSAAAATSAVQSNAAPAQSSSAAAAAAPASSSSRPASSSAAAAASSSSSNRPSSSSTPAPSSSSSSRASSTASSSTFFAGSSDAQSASSSGGALPGRMIGAIAGGVVGGIAFVVLAFMLWRRCKGRKDRVPPPPPREMAFNTASTSRSRAMSGGMMESGLGGAAGIQRENSYATLLRNQPSQMSRGPSFYSTYPIATPSSANDSPPDTSPAMYPVEDPALIGITSAGMAASSSGGEGGDYPARPASRQSRRITSMDRIRMEASASVAGARGGMDRPSSPASLHFPQPAPYSVPEESPDGGYSPPFPSSGSPSRTSSSPMLSQGRPNSMSSLSSRGYLHVGPARGAPHQGRPIQLSMPRMLSTASSDMDIMNHAMMQNQIDDYLPNPHPQSPVQPQQRRSPPSISFGGPPNQSGRNRMSGTQQRSGSSSGH